MWREIFVGRSPAAELHSTARRGLQTSCRVLPLARTRRDIDSGCTPYACWLLTVDCWRAGQKNENCANYLLRAWFDFTPDFWSKNLISFRQQCRNWYYRHSAIIILQDCTITCKYRYMVSYAEVLIISHLAPFSRTGSSARSTKDKFSCGTGILPVHKSLIENGAISKYNQT